MLCADKKWLGATPGIIQVLHTWNQELGYHVHMDCIVSGGGLTKDGGMSMAELLKAVWDFDVCLYPECGRASMRHLGRMQCPLDKARLFPMQC